jgi:hypothetical protein
MTTPPKDGTIISTEEGYVFYNPLQDKWRTFPEGYLLGDDKWELPANWQATMGTVICGSEARRRFVQSKGWEFK